MDALEFLKTAKRRCENGEKEIYSVIDLEKIDIEKYVKKTLKNGAIIIQSKHVRRNL